jgi:hypothetical protein
VIRDARRLFAASRFAAALSVAAAVPAAAQNLPVMVGQERDVAVAALKARGIAFREAETPGSGRRITYAQNGEDVTLEFAPWPADPNAPAAAFETSAAGKRLTLVRILDLAPSSGARRAWVNGFAREGRGWSYLEGSADARRPAADRSKYPVAAALSWAKPPAAFLFQAARPAGSPPAEEATALEILLENPHKPRRF